MPGAFRKLTRWDAGLMPEAYPTLPQVVRGVMRDLRVLAARLIA
jgi:hypothetical protein